MKSDEQLVKGEKQEINEIYKIRKAVKKSGLKG